MSNPNSVKIVFVLDESGSMSHLRQDVIGGFNTLIAEQRKVEGPADVTLYKFGNKVEKVFDSVDLASVPDLDESNYFPGGMTAMNDAIGASISAILKEAPEKAIINIFTDGYENASREYTVTQVKELVKEAEAKGYQVVFLAANIDEVAVGTSMGLQASSTRGFAANSAGLEGAYLSASAATMSYRTGA